MALDRIDTEQRRRRPTSPRWHTAALAALLAAPIVAHAAKRWRQRAAIDPQYRPRLGWPLTVPFTPSLIPVLRRGMALLDEPLPAGVIVSPTTAPGVDGAPTVPVIVYEPPVRDRPAPALLWIHGGGYVIGSPGGYHAHCAHLARELGIRVISVDYRLAPEHRFPAALEDCWSALRWLIDTADDHGVDPTRIAVGGDSAGGGLAATLAQYAHDHDTPLALQLLVYPLLDDRSALADVEPGTGAFVWTPTANATAWQSYLGRRPSHTDADPYAAAARRDDLDGLAPAWIGVGSLDLVVTEDRAYAVRLRSAGVDCDLVEVPGAYHAFHTTRPDAPGAQAFVAAQVAALDRSLHRR